MRLDKYLAHSTGLSRKEVKRVLHKDNITVNETVTRDPSLKIKEGDVVTFHGKTVGQPEARYFMLNKPAGYVCSNDDPTHPTIAGLLLNEIRPNELNIAGRLDADTTGLILITDDGQWSHKVTSPNHKQPKRYKVETVAPINPSAVAQFEEGVQLHGEKHLTKPAKLEIIETHIAYLTLTEGRYHQVKRMFAAIDNKVAELHRESIGAIVLDPDLAEGDYRPLTVNEIEEMQ